MIKNRLTADEYVNLTWEEKVLEWNTFYRRNIHRFIIDYLGINLYLYQSLWLTLMDDYKSFCCVGARSMAKSFIIALYSVARCILYPGTTIKIAASTRGQASIIIDEKIDKIFYQKYPNVRREIEDLVSNSREASVKFVNGSRIEVVTAGDSARGNRSQINIYEEFRLIKKDIIDQILRPFAEVRQAPYLAKEEWKDCFEEFKELYISSAGYKSEWIYDTFKNHVKSCLLNVDDNTNKLNGFFGTDYLIAVKHRIKTWNDIETAREEGSSVSFGMEYENLFQGEDDGSFYKLNDFQKLQIINKAFIPYKFADVIPRKSRYNNATKAKDELRILVADIAMSAGDKNDNSVVWCLSGKLDNKMNYVIECRYVEALNGVNTEMQVLRFKQLFYDFQADYFMLDMLGGGKSIYDLFTKQTEDNMRSREDGEMIVYDAWTIAEEKDYLPNKNYDIEDLRTRTIDKANAVPLIIPIAGTADINHMVHISMKDALDKNMVSFLVDANKGEEYLLKSKTLDVSASKEEKKRLVSAYKNTEEMINEAIFLQQTVRDGKIKLSEKPGMRKDRYVSLAYGVYLFKLISLTKQRSASDIEYKDFYELLTNRNPNRLGVTNRLSSRFSTRLN